LIIFLRMWGVIYGVVTCGLVLLGVERGFRKDFINGYRQVEEKIENCVGKFFGCVFS
jgi:hypothetical protein